MIHYLRKITKGEVLTQAEAYEAMALACDDAVSSPQIAAFLSCLHMRKENVNELQGFLTFLRDKQPPIRIDGATLDMCGTGGDLAQTFNISTAAALVVASHAAGAGRWPNCGQTRRESCL